MLGVLLDDDFLLPAPATFNHPRSQAPGGQTRLTIRGSQVLSGFGRSAGYERGGGQTQWKEGQVQQYTGYGRSLFSHDGSLTRRVKAMVQPEKLERDEMLDLLAVQTAIRLVLPDESSGQPYLVPVSFVLLGGSVYFYTEAGRKLTLLQASPGSAAFEVDNHDRWAAWSILAYGSYFDVPNPAERAAATGALLMKYRIAAVAPIWSRSSGQWSLFVRNLSAAKLGRIRIERMSGRRWR